MNRLATGLILLLVVAGPPLTGALWLGRHPWRWPTRADVQAWLQQPLTAATIVAGCLIVAVAAWLLLLSHLTWRATHHLRARWRRLRRLPLPTPAQMTAGSMAGVAALVLPGPAPADGRPGPSPVTTALLPHDGGSSDTPASAPPGIDLPGGGWIPYRTALAVSAAAALLWLHRRHRYPPGPPNDQDRDRGLRPMPATARTVTAALADLPTGRDRLPVSIDPLPHGVVALTGPGAPAAARGLLVTAALCAATGQPVTIRIHPDDLARLLPDLQPRHLHRTGVHLDTTTSPGPHDDTAPHPPSPPPPGRDGTRGRGEPATVIRLGDHPTATVRWHVTRDGTTTGTGITTGHRLCILDPAAAADLITLAGHAHGHRTAGTAAEHTAPPPAAAVPARAAAAPADAGRPAGHLALLGRCDLTVAGEPVHLRRRAGLQILAYLAAHPDGATSGDLVAACWPGIPPDTITQRLHTTLSDLRRQLHPLLNADPVLRRHDRYQLNHTAIGCDLWPLADALHAATHTTGESQRRAWHTVTELYRGDLAAGHDWAWLAPAREALRRDVVDTYTALAASSDSSYAAALLHAATTVDPDNRDLHQLAADALHATGDHRTATTLLTGFRRRHARTGLPGGPDAPSPGTHSRLPDHTPPKGR